MTGFLSRRLFLRHMAAASALAAPAAAAASASGVGSLASAVPAVPTSAAFDYEAAIATLESWGVQLAGVINANGQSEGYAIRYNGISVYAVEDILDYWRGFYPYEMGEVLARQGKLRLPPRTVGAVS